MRGAGSVRARLRGAARSRALRRLDPVGIADVWIRQLGPLEVPGLIVGPDDPRLVVLPKLGGTEDVVASLTDRGATGLHPVALPRSEVKAVFRAVLGPLAGLLSDTDYRLGDERLEAGKASYRALLADVVDEVHRRMPLAGFVGANVAYFAERELAAACEQVGIPFIVLHKESLRTPRQREYFTRAYRERIGSFGGRMVATYNESERASQIEAGIVAPDRIRVVGSPRIDALHRLREARSMEPSLGRAVDGTTVLFAIDPAAGTWTPFDAEESTGAPRWGELARRTERVLGELALAHPERRFIIKVKLGREAATLDRLVGTFPHGPPSNLEIVTGGTATSLLRSASAVIAFNSTVILEGLAAGVPVVVPRFAEAEQPGADAWILDLEDAVETAASEHALAVAIRGAWRRQPPATLTASARAALERHVGDSDGLAGASFFSAIDESTRLMRCP